MVLKFSRLAIPEVVLLEPNRHRDQRGYFEETYSRRAMSEIGIGIEFVQDNHSYSRDRGVLRGLHFQISPAAQDKLVRVARGSILDVAVDLRHGSPSYGKWVATVLSAENGHQLFIPKGFAHGYCTLQTDTEVLYKTSDYYAPEHDRGVLWDDPDLGVEWPVGRQDAILSPKDSAQPRFVDLPRYFTY